jgi:hypothetical protein
MLPSILKISDPIFCGIFLFELLNVYPFSRVSEVGTKWLFKIAAF